MTTATARHILVKEEAQCNDIINEIKSGGDFAKLAEEHSSCPSGKSGGILGSFTQGQMVPEFDKIVFVEEIGLYEKPVKTQFGYHLLEVTSRAEE